MDTYKEEAPIKRVARMEAVYDQSCQAVEALLQAAQTYLDRRAQLRELEEYYLGPVWMADFDRERAGEFPRDMKRGILTEDAIYDLLTDEARMKGLLETVMELE